MAARETTISRVRWSEPGSYAMTMWAVQDAMAPPQARPRAGVIRRTAGAALLLGVAASHLVDVQHHIEEAPYLAWLFVALAAASVVLAALLCVPRLEALAWLAALWLSLTAIAGYVVSRTVGLPQLDHVGDWTEPAGIVAVGCETGLVVLALLSLPSAGGRFGFARLPPSAIATVTAGLVGIVVGGAAEQGTTGVVHTHTHTHSGAEAHSDGHQHAHASRGGHTHRHDIRHGTGHLEVTPSGRVLFGMRPLDVSAATAAERTAALALLRDSRIAAERLFPTMAAARALGYEIDPARRPDDPTILHPHLTNESYIDDGRMLDPERPESIVYERRPSGRLVLVAFMFRARSGAFDRPSAGSLVQWHVHGGCVRAGTARRGVIVRDSRCPRGRVLKYGATMMFHLWLKPDDLELAYSDAGPSSRRSSG